MTRSFWMLSLGAFLIFAAGVDVGMVIEGGGVASILGAVFALVSGSCGLFAGVNDLHRVKG